MLIEINAEEGKRMMNHVVYLYKDINDRSNVNKVDNNYLKKLELYPIVAIDNLSINSPDCPPRKDIVKDFKLKPFEIIQNNFDLFIKKSELLNVQIKLVEFSDDVDFELKSDFIEALDIRNYKKAFNLIKFIREDNIDISAISFIYEANSFRITKYAMAEVPGDKFTDVVKILEESPLPMVAGFKKFPE